MSIENQNSPSSKSQESMTISASQNLQKNPQGSESKFKALEITEIGITHNTKRNRSTFLGFARIILNDQLVLDGIKILKGKFGLFIEFPSNFNKKEGRNYSICFPVTKNLHATISDQILAEYRNSFSEEYSKQEIPVQNEVELRQELERLRNDCSKVEEGEAMEDPKTTPEQIENMEESLVRCYLSIDHISGLLGE